MAIDYGSKRTGIAVTDPSQIIATGLDTVATAQLFEFLDKYLLTETVEMVVIGEPLNMDNTPTHNTQPVYDFTDRFKKKYPHIPVEYIDERMTSSMAKDIIIQSGYTKKKRRDKSLVDKVSAIIILQDYMNIKGI